MYPKNASQAFLGFRAGSGAKSKLEKEGRAQGTPNTQNFLDLVQSFTLQPGELRAGAALQHGCLFAVEEIEVPFSRNWLTSFPSCWMTSIPHGSASLWVQGGTSLSFVAPLWPGTNTAWI